MEFHILTLFPDAIIPYGQQSILKRAVARGLIKLHFHQLRDYAHDKHARVDDRPYGGGAGMVMKVDVVVHAVRSIKQLHAIDRVVLLSPRGKLFDQQTAEDLTQVKSLLLVCGRYEGVDERAIELVVDWELSIGDYVLSGGELPAMIVVEAVARLLPGVVGDARSPMEESHTAGLLEYPHYTRPEVFETKPVPVVLLSGDHAAIEKWRHEKSLQITQKNRPDLWQRKK